MKLVIVESPTKAQTIKKFLGKDFKILSTFGHVRDLPEKEFGIKIKENFQPKYVILPKAKKILKVLKEFSKKAKVTILATDEDREGEAIAWHLIQILNLKKFQKDPKNSKIYQRIVFHEITKDAILQALKNPRQIDMNLVNSQKARRILDRIVGYKLSPFLWKKVFRGLSAGRVQSVAVRLIVEREREIENFKPQEYWTIEAKFKKEGKEFSATLIKKDGKTLSKLEIKTKKEAKEIVKDLKKAQFLVVKIEKKQIKKNPFPPFITSTLQQEAWKKFHWPAKFTMKIAQNLYEQGFITYHRTDSLNLSQLSLDLAKKYIIENFGKIYWQKRKYKTKRKSAQEAHEAIRPTRVEFLPSKIENKNQQKLYQLIWQRFLASQMSSALFDATLVEIEALSKEHSYLFRTQGQILKFDGFLKIYPIEYKEKDLPSLEEKEILKALEILPLQHFTKPPARYNEASLIKTLEKNEIGRPSTYAPILATIQERNYVQKDEKKFLKPTEIGILVNDLLVEHFPEIVDIKFTAKMEKDLDKIAQGKIEWIEVLRNFYQPFEEKLKEKYLLVQKEKVVPLEKTQKKCPLCQAFLVKRLGKYGKFYACSNFPQCKYTQDLPERSFEIFCPKCQKGKIVEKRTKKGKIFYACSNYPKCDFAFWEKPIGKNCPKCNSLLVQKNKKIFCQNPECDYQEFLK